MSVPSLLASTPAPQCPFDVTDSDATDRNGGGGEQFVNRRAPTATNATIKAKLPARLFQRGGSRNRSPLEAPAAAPDGEEGRITNVTIISRANASGGGKSTCHATVTPVSNGGSGPVATKSANVPPS